MLEKTDYLCAIIPDSFITSGRFTERLYAVDTTKFSTFTFPDKL